MINKFESTIVEDVMMNINVIFGNEKNSFLGITMLKHCPINISIKNENVDIPHSTKDFVHNNLAAWVENGVRGINIELTISKDKEPELLEFISKNSHILTYIVVHEFMHILRLDNTASVKNMHLKVYDDHHMINAAMDYNINLTVSNLLNKAGINTELDNIGLYDTKYENMTSIEILEDLKDNATCTTEEFSDDMESVTIDNGDTIGRTIKSKEPVVKTDEDSKQDSRVVAMANAMANTISKQAGNDSKEILGEKLLKVKTNSDWFKQMKKSLSTILFLSTSGSRSTWSNINSTYRHKFKAPAVYNRKKTISNILLYIDSSGSVDSESLGRVFDIIDSNKKKIDSITINVFDTEIVKSTKTSNKREMVDLVSTRIAVGGTDIQCIVNNLKSYSKKELSRSIIVIVSDMYFADRQDRVFDSTIKNYWVHAIKHRDVSGLYYNSEYIYLK